MHPAARPAQAYRRPTFIELFTPKLVTVLREGYGLSDLRADAVAGLTVAIVALPLSMAIAIAAGVGPERGLYTAIVGGLLVSLLGGSRFQIGGPAGAFIVLMAGTVERHGYDGLALATLIAGAVLVVLGLLRLGTYVKYIPFPVTVGFTAGIAIIILASQIKDLLGLALVHEPAELLPKLAALWQARATVSIPTVAVTALSLAIILGLRRFRPQWPAFLIAVTVAAAVTALLQLDVATIQSRFGAMPAGLLPPALPPLSLDKVRAVLPDALAIALLGAVESLLSAVVADGMTGRRHRSNGELIAQGAANAAAALFGGICVTGTVARTATNVRSGAKGPLAGICHAVFLLLFMLLAAPLAGYIPLAALGAVLAIVAWNMAEKDEVAALLRASRGDALVLLATLLLTVFVDLVAGIAVGIVLGSLLILRRLAETVQVEGTFEDRADATEPRPEYQPGEAGGEVMVFRISGAFFFGATARVSQILDRVGQRPRVFILDFSAVPLIDSTAAKALEGFVRKLRRSGTEIYVAGAQGGVRRTLLSAGLKRPAVHYSGSVESAKAAAAAPIGGDSG